jgi:predicted ATPase
MEVVSQNAAVSLFVQRAAAVQPEFSLTPQNAPNIAEICRVLDGLPLAIELAAARLKLFWPATLLERLTPALPILTRGGQDLPERQQTMRSAIAWSYDLLDPQLQRFFRCFSIFGGGLTLDAAEQVCALASEPAAPMLDVLAALMDQSLVARMMANTPEPRFRLLSTLREFGVERLKECGETDDVACRHAQYFVDLVEAESDGEQSTRQTPSPLHLEAERYNLRLAYDWAVQHREHAIAERISKALAYFWWLSDDGGRGRHWVEAPIAQHDDAGVYH